MNKLSFVVMGMVVIASCATPKASESSKGETSDVTNVYRQAEIKQAVEMRRFLIKFNRIYAPYGGSVDLVPQSNYIVLDGDKVVISAAYIGRQYGVRPISGIDMIGQAVAFEVKNNTNKGVYEIKMKVKNGQNTFNVNLRITDNGFCDTSVDNYRLDHVRYTGDFIPLKPKAQKDEAPADPVM